MSKFLAYIATALVPVFLAWALGYVKIPDSVDFIDYSASGAELINSQEQLTSSLKIQAGDKPIEKLSIYNIRFANNSSKNLQKVQIEFKISAPLGSELIASTINGPQDYSDSLVKKIGESKKSVTYTIDFINVTTKSSRDYFTASFLFSGPPPEVVIPISLSPSIGFVDAKENSKTNILATSIMIILLVFYIAFIWWAISSGKKEGKIRQEKFKKEMINFFSSNFSLSNEIASEKAKEVLSLKDSVFKPETRLKKWFKNWLSEMAKS